MAIVLNGTGSISGLSAGGLPDASVTQSDLATGVAGTGPAFSVSKNANQSISGSTWTKISFQTEEFDTNSNFDNATNYRFTPTIAGYYQVTGCAWMGGQPQQRVTVWKNGTYYRTGHVTANGGGYNNSSFVSCLVYLNGSTDYIELYAWQNSGLSKTTTNAIDAANNVTWLNGSLVRSA